jgi:hypothetical protein
MTLRMEQVLPEMRAVIKGHVQQLDAIARGLDAAQSRLESWAADPAATNSRILAAMAESPRPFALCAHEPATFALDPPPVRPVIVVAADGSSIAPDRFSPVPCYVINTGYVSLPYGTLSAVAMGAEATVGPKSLLLAAEDDGTEAVDARGFGVELLRDVLELERGEDLAAHAMESGETVLLLDGTLLPWDLDAVHIAESVRADALARTEATLSRLRAFGPGLSLGAYISATRAAEVSTSLAALAGSGPLPFADAAIFRRLLEDGQRSALFKSQSRRSGRVETRLKSHGVAFFYLRIGADVARVELPDWAASESQVARLHTTLVAQCLGCDGYPRALQEAHEQAVISGADRIAFSRLLEREAWVAGLAALGGGKAESKRRRAI